MKDLFLKYLNHSFHQVPTSFSLGLLVVFGVASVLLIALLGYKKGYIGALRLFLLEYLVWIFSLTVLFRNKLTVMQYSPSLLKLYHAYQNKSLYSLSECISNICIFIPIGFLLCCSFDKMKWWKAFLIGGGVSVLIEVCQLLFRRGTAELSDVVYNTLGCMIGYGVYRAIVCLAKHISRIKQFKTI